MYSTLKVWDTFGSEPEDSNETREYASLWRSIDKVVYSATLQSAETQRTRIEPVFDPVDVRTMTDAADRDVSVGGATLAATALRAGIVDRVDLYLNPVVVGGGTPALPDGIRLDLELHATERFSNGVVYLRYAVDRR